MGEDNAIQFDRAKYAGDGANATPCANCKKPIQGEQYWKVRALTVCGPCRDAIAATVDRSQSAASFGKAALQGGLVALGCGIAYAIFTAVSNIQLALVTIGIGFVIARVVRKASGGLGGRRFQVLAVALTYLASTMGYVPPIVRGIRDAAHKAQPATSAQDAAEPDAPSAPAEPPSPPRHSPVVAIAILAGFVVALSLAAPFLDFTEAPLGLLIVLFGLWEAWKLSRAVPLVIEGPFRMAPVAEAAAPGS